MQSESMASPCISVGSFHEMAAGSVMTFALALQEGRLVLKHRECLLQTVDLGFPSGFALFVRLRLCNAALGDLSPILVHCCKLGVHTIPITRGFSDGFIECCSFFGLELDVLHLLRSCHLVLLRDLLIRCLLICFFCLLLGQVAGEIRLDNFQHADDAATSTFILLKLLWRLWLLHERAKLVIVLQQRGIFCGSAAKVIAKNLQGLPHTCESFCQLLRCHGVLCMTLGAGLVHFQLQCLDFCQLSLKVSNLLLQLCRLGGSLVNLGGQLCDIILKLILLCLCLGHLLITISLLGCVLLCLFLKLCNHCSDQPLDFGKRILASGCTIASGSGDLGCQLSKGG